jgi:superfamily II DNA or RNA helicase
MEADAPDHMRYEHQMVEEHAATHPGADVHHWSRVPETMLIDAGYIHDANQWRLERKRRLAPDEPSANPVSDYGIDGLAKVGPGEFHGLQAKRRKAGSYLRAKDLGSFTLVVQRMRVKHPASRGVVYTDSKLTRELADDLALVPGYDVVYMPLREATVAAATLAVEQPVEPWPHQVEALDALRAWDGKRGALVMPPGSGKTMVMGMWGRDLTRVVVCSPTRALAAQTLMAMGRQMPDHRRLLVDCDSAGTRDAVDVAAAWADSPLLISTTYVSLCDVVAAIITDDAVLMVDEAHHLNDETRLGAAVNALKCRVLLVTGTPPAALADDDDTDVVYMYSYERAVLDRRICDYSICVPHIVDPVGDRDHDELVVALGADMVSRCHFLANGMLRTGATRCIVYAGTVVEAKAYREAIVSLAAKFQGVAAWARVITGETPVTERDTLIRDFQAGYAMYRWFFLCSVRVLDEGIDVPACDAVYIANSVGNEARFVQRMCRANRLDYPCKTANVFVWSDETNMDATLRATARIAGTTGRHPRVHRVSTDYARAVEPAVDAALAARVEVLCVTTEERWHRRLAQLDLFLRDNGKRPSTTSTDTNVKRIGHWCDNQQQLYDATGPPASKGALRAQTVHDAWTALVERHPLIFASAKDQWHRSAQHVDIFIKRTGKRPSRRSTDPAERTLGDWVNNQVVKFNQDGPDASNGLMSSPIIHTAWANLVKGHMRVLGSTEDRWYATANEVRDFANRTGKRPPQQSTDPDQKRIGLWVSTQLLRHNPAGPSVSKEAHRTPGIHSHWAALVLEFPFLKGRRSDQTTARWQGQRAALE